MSVGEAEDNWRGGYSLCYGLAGIRELRGDVEDSFGEVEAGGYFFVPSLGRANFFVLVLVRDRLTADSRSSVLTMRSQHQATTANNAKGGESSTAGEGQGTPDED